MKNIKTIVTYGLILLLCIGAFSGYFISKIAHFTKDKNQIETAAKEGARDENAGEKHIKEVMDKSARMPASHVVGIARGEDWSQVTKEVIDNAGGIGDMVKKGDTVVILPNLIRGAPAGSPVCTDYRVIQEISDLAKEAGAGRIVVAVSSPAGNVFIQAEYDKLKGVELIDMNECQKEDCYELQPEKSKTGKAIMIPKIYMDADVVIGAAKLKTHQMRDAQVTLGLKISMGVPPSRFYFGNGYKIGLHNLGLKEVITDLNRIRRPDLVVIDGVVAGEGLGPVDVEPVKSNIMFAGSDLVALDTVALTFMGYTVGEVPHVKLAAEEGLGISDLSRIKVVGGDVNAIKTRFKRPFE